jgi:hypothetical protein
MRPRGVYFLIAARIVRAPVLAVAHAIAVTVAIGPVRNAVPVTVAFALIASTSRRNFVSDATGQDASGCE